MPKKASDIIKTDRIKQKNKNGTIYVFERKKRYNPQKRYTEILGTKLLGKLKPGESDIYNDANIEKNRPKRTAVPTTNIKKYRSGMIDIIRHFSNISGIDKELEVALPGEEGVAQKLLTCAWFLFASDGDAMPGIRSWSKKYEGQIPYRSGTFTKDTYNTLFAELGKREDVRQSIFKQRAKRLGDGIVLAMDSSTFETEASQISSGRKAMHKDGLIKKVYKIVNFYSLDSRCPVAYSLIPGNIPDSESVANALQQLESLCLNHIEIISDNGYCTEDAIARMLGKGQHFITRIEADTEWVQPLIARHRRTLEHGGGIIECDPLFSGVRSSVKREFRQKDGMGVVKKLNVFIYFSSSIKSRDDIYFRETFGRHRHSLMNGTALCDDRKAVESFAEKYMEIGRDSSGTVTHISENAKNYDKKMKYNGYLVLIADKEDDKNAALEKYRKREYIEEEIKNYKSHTGGKRARVWTDEALEGQMMAQFLSLTLRESMCAKIRFLKDTLAKPNGEAAHDRAESLKQERQLYNWLHKNAIHDILHWFDAVMTTEISDGNETVVWRTETTKRDRLFIEKIGLDISKEQVTENSS